MDASSFRIGAIELMNFNFIMPQRVAAKRNNEKAPILIVDDNLEVCELYHDYLSAKGFTIHTFSSPKKALRKFRTITYKLLITDINMPGMNGWELIRNVVKLNPYQRIIVVSANKKDTFYEEYAKVAKIRYLQKPFSIHNLESIINEVLSEAKRGRGKLGFYINGLIDSCKTQGEGIILELTNKTKKGRLCIEKGVLVHVETTDKRGKEALKEISEWTLRNFSIKTYTIGSAVAANIAFVEKNPNITLSLQNGFSRFC